MCVVYGTHMTTAKLKHYALVSPKIIVSKTVLISARNLSFPVIFVHKIS